jgi:hypothetical protein
MATTLEIPDWAREQFGSCELGDRRRVERIVEYATQAASRPDAPTPRQTENWADCKAAYRLFNNPRVTFESVTAPHRAMSRAVRPGVWLVIDDTTEINFGYDRRLPGTGRVGTNKGRGFLLHSALVVSRDGLEIVGVAGQELYVRPLKRVARGSSAQRKKRACETDMWGRVIDRVGRAPAGARFVHVCDRGADNFDVYCHLARQEAGFVIRAAQLKRIVLDEAGEKIPLGRLLETAPVLGHYKLDVPENNDQPARRATLVVRAAPLIVPRPKAGLSRFARESGPREIPMWAVDAREIDAPRGVKPLRWALLASETVATFDDAWQVVGDYEKRWLIEEYHKCLKTGARVEDRLYRSGDALAPVVGLLSVLAARLLQLKTVARREPDLPVERMAPPAWVAAVQRLRDLVRPIATVRDFIRAVAGLGGFLGRKSDGEPGWQTIWRGLETLLLCLRGAETLGKRCG